MQSDFESAKLQEVVDGVRDICRSLDVNGMSKALKGRARRVRSKLLDPYIEAHFVEDVPNKSGWRRFKTDARLSENEVLLEEAIGAMKEVIDDIIDGKAPKLQIESIVSLMQEKELLRDAPLLPDSKMKNSTVTEAGNWLIPTSLADMANRLGNIGAKKVKTLLKQYGLKHAGNRQLWTVCIDSMPANMREQLERGR